MGNGPWRRGHPFGVLDIGSSKLCCYIARPRPGQGVQLLGRGYQLAEGLKGGEIVDAEAAEAAVLARPARGRAAGRRDLARDRAGGQRRAAAVELCAGGLRAARPRRQRGRPAAPARPRAPRGVHARARGAACGAGRGHASTAAARSGTRAACPGSGSRSWRIWSRSSGPALRNLLACLERCHIEVKGVVSASYAAAIACLAEDELERGCLVLDFGGGTTGLAALRRWPADPGRPGPLWRRPHHRRSRLRPVDQPPACRADQEPVRRHAVSQLRRRHPHRACRGSATMPSCRPARCRAPGSPRSCAPGSRRSWRWRGAGSTSIASCWRPGRRARSC